MIYLLYLYPDTPLEKLPRRKTDNAHIIQAGKREYRFKTKPLEPVTFKRYFYKRQDVDVARNTRHTTRDTHTQHYELIGQCCVYVLPWL
jgi:hypothetical protein